MPEPTQIKLTQRQIERLSVIELKKKELKDTETLIFEMILEARNIDPSKVLNGSLDNGILTIIFKDDQ